MLESGDTFATFVRRYRLDRSEGLVLRYLTDAWRTLDGTLPPTAITPVLEDVIEWLGAMIRATDATLLDEWEMLSRGEAAERDRPGGAADRPGRAAGRRGARRCARPRSGGWSCSRRGPTTSSPLGPGGRPTGSDEAMAPYWEHVRRRSGIDADARSAASFDLQHEPVPDGPGRWVITQRLADPAGDGEWRFVATVDLASALDEGAPVSRARVARRRSG